MTSARTIRIFDTTLRDGEQSPGASMNLTEKMEIAQALQHRPCGSRWRTSSRKPGPTGA